jgi:hypothetical protein
MVDNVSSLGSSIHDKTPRESSQSWGFSLHHCSHRPREYPKNGGIVAPRDCLSLVIICKYNHLDSASDKGDVLTEIAYSECFL